VTKPNLTVRLVKPTSLELHPQAKLVPEMPAEQYKVFLADIKKRLLIDKPIELIPGTTTVIDGRTRLRAANEAGLAAVPVVDADLGPNDSPVLYMMRVAYLRRHLKPSQAAMLGVEIEKEFAREARARKKEAGAAAGKLAGKGRAKTEPAAPQPKPEPAPKSRDKAAAVVGVSPRLISDAKAVEKKSPELAAKVRAGEMDLSEAKKELKAKEPKPVTYLNLIPDFPLEVVAPLADKKVFTVEDLDAFAREQSTRPGRSGVSRFRSLRDLGLNEDLAEKVCDALDRAAAPKKEVKGKPANPLAPKPLSQIADFPPALAAALETIGIRTEVSLSQRVAQQKGSHEERIGKVLATAPGTYPNEVARGVAAVLNYLYPGRKKVQPPAVPPPAPRGKKSAEEELEDLGLLTKKDRGPDFLPCPFCGSSKVEEKPLLLSMRAMQCQECFCRGPEAAELIVARDRWNARAKAPTPEK
jgi:hypothetical protein